MLAPVCGRLCSAHGDPPRRKPEHVCLCCVLKDRSIHWQSRICSSISKQNLKTEIECLLPLYLQSLLGRKLDFPVAQLVKNLPAMRETWVQSLGWEGPLEKGKAWRIPWRRERLPTPVFWPGELHGLYGPRGRKQLDMTERLSLCKVVKNMSFWRKQI